MNLHNAQESLENIYLCFAFFKKAPVTETPTAISIFNINKRKFQFNKLPDEGLNITGEVVAETAGTVSHRTGPFEPDNFSNSSSLPNKYVVYLQQYVILTV